MTKENHKCPVKMAITDRANYINIMDYVKSRLIPGINAKKQRGEVFTPLSLINGMLDYLPNEVWSNPDLKWLDPANGIGNFPICVYYRLMKGLKSKIAKAQDRSRHIIENMLYMVELDPTNVEVSKSIFCERDDGAAINGNIHLGSFLEDGLISKINSHLERGKKWPVKFDVIMGNPPYNKGGVGKGGGVFWVEFVDKSIPLLNDNGILHFIHPKGWRKPYKDGDRKNNAGRVWYDFKRLGLLEYVNISDDPPKNFPKVDYYVWRKTTKPLNKLTIVENLFQKIYTISEIDISNLQFIPNLINDNSLDILNKMFSDRLSGNYFQIIRDQSFTPSTDKKSNSGIKIAVNPDGDGGYNLMKSNISEYPEFWNKKKIILTYISGSSSKQSKLYPVYYEEPIGLGNRLMYFLENNKKDGKILKSYFNSKLITFLLKITQFVDGQMGANEYKILNLLKIPQLTNPVTDKSIYEYYGLNKSNISLVDAVISNSNDKVQKIFQSVGS